MFIWCSILFALGILAFLDSIFNMGDIFRQVNSVLFMLISLGLLIRTTTKMKTRELEHFKQQALNLEHKVRVLEESQRRMEGL